MSPLRGLRDWYFGTSFSGMMLVRAAFCTTSPRPDLYRQSEPLCRKIEGNRMCRGASLRRAQPSEHAGIARDGCASCPRYPLTLYFLKFFLATNPRAGLLVRPQARITGGKASPWQSGDFKWVVFK